MLAQKKGPGRRPGPRLTAPMPVQSIPDRRPRCKLYGAPVVDRLPGGCPFAESNPLAVVGDLERDAFALLAPGPGHDPGGGLDLLDRHGVCFSCVDRLIAHPRIKHLRAQVTNALPAPDPRPAPAMQTPKAVVTRRVSRRRVVARA